MLAEDMKSLSGGGFMVDRQTSPQLTALCVAFGLEIANNIQSDMMNTTAASHARDNVVIFVGDTSLNVPY